MHHPVQNTTIPSRYRYLFQRVKLKIPKIYLNCSVLKIPLGSDGKKNLSAIQEPRVQSLGWEDPLEKEMATHSSLLAWRIPWT